MYIYIYALHILFCNYISFLEANHFQVSCSDSGRIYIPGTCLSSILVVEPSKTRSFLIKTKVILVAVHILMTRSFPGGMCRHSNFINSLELHTRVSWIARVSLSCSLKKWYPSWNQHKTWNTGIANSDEFLLGKKNPVHTASNRPFCGGSVLHLFFQVNFCWPPPPEENKPDTTRPISPLEAQKTPCDLFPRWDSRLLTHGPPTTCENWAEKDLVIVCLPVQKYYNSWTWIYGIWEWDSLTKPGQEVKKKKSQWHFCFQSKQRYGILFSTGVPSDGNVQDCSSKMPKTKMPWCRCGGRKNCSVLQTDGHVNDPDTQSFLKKLRNTWTIYLVICTYIYSHIYKSKGSARLSVPCYLSQLKWTVAVAPVSFPAIKVHVALGCSWLFVEF